MACRRNGYWAIPPSTPTTSAPTSGPSTPRPSSPRILRGPRNCRSTNTSTRKGIWSNAASTSSSTSGAWQPVTRRLRGTSSPSSPSRLSPCGSDDCQQDLGPWPDIVRLWADDAAAFLLLEDVCAPAGGAAHREQRGEGAARHLERLQEQRGVVLDVDVETPAGLVLAQRGDGALLDRGGVGQPAGSRGQGGPGVLQHV